MFFEALLKFYQWNGINYLAKWWAMYNQYCPFQLSEPLIIAYEVQNQNDIVDMDFMMVQVCH